MLVMLECQISLVWMNEYVLLDLVSENLSIGPDLDYIALT